MLRMCQLAKRNAENKTQPGRLRIVAGNWRSRLLEIADVPGLRPTSARIRETVFNWLAPRIAGARCLDLFAGTGALGLEALSRGAADCVFVEKSAKAAKTLRANIVALQAENAVVHETKAAKFLRQGSAEPFEIVFLDPPFAADILSDLCRLLEESSILADNARIYIEEDRSQPELMLPELWQVMKTKNSGNVRYSLLDAGSQT
jgi:16S rRNA (guanine966-N2)-methyltransferase